MNRRLSGPARVLVLLLALAGGCSLLTQKVILDGAVAEKQGNRVHIAAQAPLQGVVGQKVTIYQRIEQAAVDPTSKSWQVLKPVATGTVAEITPQGAWIIVESGTVEPRGEIQLRRSR